MEPTQWGGTSFELAAFLVGGASENPASPQRPNEEELGAVRLMAGFSRSKEAARKDTTNKPSLVIWGALRAPRTKLPAKALRNRLHSICVAPLELTVGNPRKWRKVVAATGLGARALEEA